MTIQTVVECVVVEQAQRWHMRLVQIVENIADEIEVPAFQRDRERLAELCLMREEAEACSAYWTRGVRRWIAKPAEG